MSWQSTTTSEVAQLFLSEIQVKWLMAWKHGCEMQMLMALIWYVLSARIRLLLTFQAYMILPQSFSDITTLLVPELQRRGLFWNKYAHPGGTYRENLMGSDVEHPAAKYRWQAPQMARDFPVPE